MPNPAILSDLEARFRPLTEPERTLAQALLDDAWAILLHHRPGLDAQVASETVSSAVARAVVSAMVLRVLRNPEGIRQWSVDDASFTRDAALSSGSLYALPEELGLLVPPGSGSGGAFTVRPVGFGVWSRP